MVDRLARVLDYRLISPLSADTVLVLEQVLNYFAQVLSHKDDDPELINRA